MQHNPKGPDGYGPRKDFTWPPQREDPWMGPEEQFNAEIGGFNVQLTFSPSRRDWHMRVVVPEHFYHPDIDLHHHLSLSRAGVRDI
ncbi:MAG: hypothetical protein NUV80_07425 [Candidatus Berkelbacteria bacterium]|nr:hypothetical protein [Candidatus Berkelbacteria bacterium]